MLCDWRRVGARRRVAACGSSLKRSATSRLSCFTGNLKYFYSELDVLVPSHLMALRHTCPRSSGSGCTVSATKGHFIKKSERELKLGGQSQLVKLKGRAVKVISAAQLVEQCVTGQPHRVDLYSCLSLQHLRFVGSVVGSNSSSSWMETSHPWCPATGRGLLSHVCSSTQSTAMN